MQNQGLVVVKGQCVPIKQVLEENANYILVKQEMLDTSILMNKVELRIQQCLTYMITRFC